MWAAYNLIKSYGELVDDILHKSEKHLQLIGNFIGNWIRHASSLYSLE